MEMIAKADVVLALGTRLNPFSSLPAYQTEYWPKDAKIIQVDINADRIGLTKKVDVGIQGDAKLVARADPGDKLSDRRRRGRPQGRADGMVARPSRAGRRSCPRWTTRTTIRRGRHLERACPHPRAGPHEPPPSLARDHVRDAREDAIISTDIGNNCAIGNAYPMTSRRAGNTGAGPVRPVRLWPALDPRRQNRPPGCALHRLRGRRRVRHLHERDDRLRAQ